ncbi:MAG: hypothetical protein LBF28_01935 [Rickettsiales bacterium]|nr:hypothetical protein [Rickettsiales bacterium]
MTWDEIASVVKDIAELFRSTATNDPPYGKRTYEECRDILMNIYYNAPDQEFKDSFPQIIVEYTFCIRGNPTARGT